ncbi:MAG TPA: ATP-binding protein [Gemmatimonadaceae bacterium]
MLVAAVAARSASDFVDNADWASRVHDARAELRALDNDIDHATNGVDAFLTTHDSSYFRRYRASMGSAEGHLAQLTHLLTTDPTGRRGLDTLRALVAFSANELSHTLALRTGGAAAADARAARIAASAAITERIEETVNELDEHESSLLADRMSTQRTQEHVVWFVVFLLAGGAVGVALATRRSIRRDLVRRTRTEEALRAAEAKFAGILSIAADGIISVNERQEIVHFNRGAETIFGYSADDVIGKPLDVLLPERFAATHHRRIEEFAHSPESAHYVESRPEIIGRRRNGQEFTAEASVSKLATADGPLFTVVLRDVTERKRIEHREHALAEAGSRLAIPLDQSARLGTVAQLPVPIVGAWCMLDVLEEDEGESTPLHRVASVHADPDLNAALRALEARGLAYDSAERAVDVLRTGTAELIAHVSDSWLEAHTHDAEHLALWRRLGSGSLLVVPLRIEGRSIGTMTIGAAPGQVFGPDDLALAVTLAERAALAIDNAWHLRRAERAIAARDRVLGVVSHDLRNALNAITMSAQSLLTSLSMTHDARERLVQNILDAGDWMQRLMRDLLDLANIEAGRLSIEIQNEAVTPIIEATREMFATRARAQRVDLRVELPARLPMVRADAERIVQVLANLVGNSLKYTSEGGIVSIGARNGGNEVVLVVVDTGAGIAAHDVPHVFERFWHAKGSSPTRGSGLGLAIAQGIVAAHGGRIWVESELGAGSTFSVALPVAASAAWVDERA